MSGEHSVVCYAIYFIIYCLQKELEEKNLNGVKPKLFKTVVAGNHVDFRTAQQQDAEEYLRYLVEQITKNTPTGIEDPTIPLKFKMESRFEDLASGQVRYGDKEEVVLSLPVREVCCFHSLFIVI